MGSDQYEILNEKNGRNVHLNVIIRNLNFKYFLLEYLFL